MEGVKKPVLKRGFWGGKGSAAEENASENEKAGNVLGKKGVCRIAWGEVDIFSQME